MREELLARFTSLALVLPVAMGISGCKHPGSPFKRCFHRHTHSALTVLGASAASPSTSPFADATRSQPAGLKTLEAEYPWLKKSRAERIPVYIPLQSRFATPKGYTRIAAKGSSIGHWLRMLPLSAEGTLVQDVNGRATLVASAGYAAAVVDIDMHAEESADALLRLHAEWRFSQGNAGGISYVSNSGRPLPFSRWLSGGRIVMKKRGWDWSPSASPVSQQTYGELRNFLDAAYQWVDPRALAIQGRTLGADDVEPGDYFVHAGKDPTLVIVLDVAKNASGEPALLLGHVAAPHQNLYVMLASPRSEWLLPRPTNDISPLGVKPFVWKEHRRLPKTYLDSPE
jgi:hypothetical protein